MMNVGDGLYLQWQHHPSEIYNTTVQMNLNGIKVINAQTKGYTLMNDSEFSGYAYVIDEITGQATMQRVFTINNDVTEVTKVDIDKEIKMNPIKIVPISSADYTGWAFIPSE
jgi:hypothetical protein